VIGFGELALTANYGTSETGVKRWDQDGDRRRQWPRNGERS